MQSVMGKVISAKMQGTVVVAVAYSFAHPRYKKVIRRTTRLFAHDEKGAKEGDEVRIVKSKPYSKKTHFVVTEILKKLK